ncbi:MAG: alpha amylase N-terminal ig-like domain-containing protein [Fusobacteriota bacterium]
MRRYLRIYKEDEFHKEVEFKYKKDDIYIYKWRKIKQPGNYSFKITDKIKNEDNSRNVTFSHTAPFTDIFEAYISEKTKPKPIGGFKKDDDILIIYNEKEETFTLKKMKFTRFVVDTTDFGYTNISKVEMPADFNNWHIYAEDFKKIDKEKFETYLALDDGIYEYKLVLDGDWVPDENQKLVVGDMGDIFPEGKMGTGNFSYEAKDPNNSRKAIKHDEFSLEYLNKVGEDEIEITIRTQKNDIENVEIHIIENDGENEFEEIYELIRIPDDRYKFDYFKKVIKLRVNSEKFRYYFKLKDGNNRGYFTKDGLIFDEDKIRYFNIDYNTGNYPLFIVPKWAKEAVWYNIFPDRFYNGDKENDPIYNEFGPEHFKKPKNKSDLIEEYKWGVETTKYGEFELHNWTSDFEEQKNWEAKEELEIDYSLKYARMYGGDLKGIKKKIPYLKKLGINAIWLNPVFFSTSNHKYGAADFRHISPDFGKIKMTGNDYGVKVSKYNKYGNKTYLDIFKKDYKKRSELKELNINLVGDKRGKNGYLETENPETWVWTESDLIAVDLIKELHKNGIRVIFDGVFNHSGTNHWAFELAMAEGKNSEYTKWYNFHDFSRHKAITKDMSKEKAYKILVENKKRVSYSGWAGFDGLPEFNSYHEEFKEYIFNITRKWMLGPDGKSSNNWMEDDGIDGFRLDVPNCLENQEFWHEWRKVVKDCKKDGYITAELWGDASSDINSGEKYDTVMNYEWLKTTIGYFINQGKDYNKAYKLKATEFFKELKEKRYWYPLQALQVSQNLNGSHDTDRLLSRIINDKLGRDLEDGKQLERGYNTIRPDLATKQHENTSIDWKKSEIKPKDILKLISIFQITYIGAPMLYYGDEVGMWGATDPYDRKPMLWEEFNYDQETDGTLEVQKNIKYDVKPDFDLFNWYKKIIKIRRENKTLIYGEFKKAIADNNKDIIAYERFDDINHYIIIMNNSYNNYEKYILGTDFQDEKFECLISGKKFITDPQGSLILNLNKKEGLILKKIK